MLNSVHGFDLWKSMDAPGILWKFISFVGFDVAKPVYLCLHEKLIGLEMLIEPRCLMPFPVISFYFILYYIIIEFFGVNAQATLAHCLALVSIWMHANLYIGCILFANMNSFVQIHLLISSFTEA